MRGLFRFFAVVSVVGGVALLLSALAGCGERKPEMPVGEIMANATSGNMESATAEQAVSATPAVPPAVQEAVEGAPAMASAYTAPTAKEIQSALKNAGYYKGAIDGKIGPKSTKAVEAFQSDNGLVVDGKVGLKTWGKLNQYLNQAEESVTATIEPIAD